MSQHCYSPKLTSPPPPLPLEPAREAYFWLDVAVNNQHSAQDLPFTWWTTTFKDSIRAIGRVVLVVTPWKRPVALSRAWCLWELYCASSQAGTGVALDLRLPAAQRPDFVQALISDFDSMADALSEMDAASAQASSEGDRLKIMAAITAETSTAALNTTVKDRLRAWCRDAGMQALESLQAAQDGAPAAGDTALQTAALCSSLGRLLRRDYGENDTALRLHEQALALRRALLGATHLDTLAAQYDVAMVHYAQGAYAAALAEMAHVAGLQHGDEVQRAVTLNSMAAAERALGNIDAAIALHQEALTLQKRLLGAQTPEVATTLNSLAASTLRLGQRAEALALLDEALAIRTALHGPRHAEVGVINNNRARLLEEQGDLDTAAAVHASVLRIRREALGPSHHKVASTMNNLATVEIKRGRLQAAAALLREALPIREQRLGNGHPKVAATFAQLAEIARLVGDPATAACLDHTAAVKRAAALGDWHPDVAQNLTSLGDALEAFGDAQAALALYTAAAAAYSHEAPGRRATLGKQRGHGLVALAAQEHDRAPDENSADAEALGAGAGCPVPRALEDKMAMMLARLPSLQMLL